MTPLDGRVALVTGSTRRNGKAIAMRLAAAGAAVMITGHASIDAARAVAAEIADRHGPARSAAHVADIRDAEAVSHLVAATVAQLGRLDILVNNAGVRGDGTFASTTLEAWHFIMRTVLDGAFLCAQAAAPHLARGGVGRIINIAGVSAHIGGRNHAAANDGQSRHRRAHESLSGRAWTKEDHRQIACHQGRSSRRKMHPNASSVCAVISMTINCPSAEWARPMNSPPPSCRSAAMSGPT